MRQVAAILLVLVFGSFSSQPLIAAPTLPLDNVPACCLRNGKHHCIMRLTGQQDTPGVHASAPPQPCPYFPRATVPAIIQGLLFAPNTGWRAVPSLLTAVVPSSQPGRAPVLLHSDSLQVRGPPSPLSI